jgi:hypothetical protein
MLCAVNHNTIPISISEFFLIETQILERVQYLSLFLKVE